MAGSWTVRDACAILPSLPGVYRFRDQRGIGMYVGRSVNLRARTQSYWGGLAGRARLRRMVAQISAVEALVCASPHEAAWLERNLLERALPRWNRARGGLEVPVWLVLDPGARAPSLRVVHHPEAATITFGPYLGADRARLVRSGLLRVWPVPATGTGLSASEREMADRRGLGPGDRDRVTALIAAALDGQDHAVDLWRTGLHEARDRAVAALAFELARKISDELDAVTWATGTQRVTSDEPVDADVHGWCEGVLISLQVRKGRMERWNSRTVAREPFPLLARTPPHWRSFADENAQLAARLLGRLPS